MRACSSCASAHRVSIDQKIRSGTSFVDIAAWLSAKGSPITRNALSRHARDHVGAGPRSSGPRPMSGDFAQDVVNRTAQRMAAGEIEPSIRDGLVAAGLLDKRSERDADRDLWAKVTLALTGQVPVRVLPQPDPDLVDFTTELDVLNNGGSYEEARAAGARAKERLLLSAGDD